MTHHTNDAFKDTLERLEVALEKPLIPGEIEAWSQDVLSEAQAFNGLLRQRAEGQHRELFEQIQEEDEGLIRRVEQMRAEDRGIREAYDAFLGEARRLREKAPAAEPEEVPEGGRIARVSDLGLALVIRVRKQELAVRTWLVESSWRDRGEVD